jgi:hypothetical protein
MSEGRNGRTGSDWRHGWEEARVTEARLVVEAMGGAGGARHWQGRCRFAGWQISVDGDWRCPKDPG